MTSSQAQRCIVKDCKGKVIGGYSPDMDVPVFGCCKKHKTIVAAAYYSFLNGDKKLLKDITGLKS